MTGSLDVWSRIKTMEILNFFQNHQKLVRHGHSRSEAKDLLIDSFNGLYNELYFHELLTLERKRSERSREPFLLLLIDIEEVGDGFDKYQVAKKVVDILSSITRDTDFKGWYHYDNTLGVVFTEISVEEKNLNAIQKHIAEKCKSALESGMDITQVEKVSMTWHIFPGRFDKCITEESARAKIYPDVLAKMARRGPAHFVKRFMDVLLSLLALLLFSPLFVIIAFLIKLTSVGPVFFKQERVGFLGKRFMFLKFRSMYMNNDPTIHEEFIKNLILSGNNKVVDKKGASCKHPQKITRDPRVTPVGSILRKASIDELPQFINVLKGEMSLVGPRPPIPYECAEYDIWHRRRVLEMKPGLTGLWQVEGRSRTTFDEMVRMDIQYIRDWSIWLDIKILAQTPWAVLTGKGAY